MRVACVAIVIVLFSLAGCSGGKCASQTAGAWTGTTVADSTLSLGEDCSFGYRASGCESTGTYAGPLPPRSEANKGTATISVSTLTGTAGGLCLPTGEHSCTYFATSGRT